MKNTWTNYGDVNPVEHGGFWVKKDIVIEDNYYVVTLSYDPNNENFIITNMYIDISDNWIDWDGLSEYLGIPFDEMEIIDKLMGLTGYYAHENFDCNHTLVNKKEDIVKELKRFDITI